MRFLSVICLLLLCTSCTSREQEDEEYLACTTEYVYGIRVNLNDFLTGEPISSCNVTYSIVEGDYSDFNQISDSGSCENETFILGSGERPGVYEIQINKERYESWRSTGVIVNATICHVQQVVLNAFLVPQN